MLAHKLIRALRQQAPGQPIVLSCTTSTAQALAQKNVQLGYTAIYNPFDLPGPVRRAFRQIRPRLIVLIEAEIWPNLLWQAKREDVPIVLANARLSPRSERRFRRFSGLTRPLFQRLNLAMAQTRADVARIAGLGVKRDRIVHTGSIKFDQEGLPDPAPQVAEFRHLLDRLRDGKTGEVILAGSTHDGEEKAIAQAYLNLKPHHPNAYLVVVPPPRRTRPRRGWRSPPSWDETAAQNGAERKRDLPNRRR